MAMRKDEFSNPTSSERPIKREFAPVQKTEFSDYEDNPNPRKVEINATESTNDRLSGQANKSEGALDVSKVIRETTGVSHAATATSAASATHAVVAAVSVVSVVAVSTLVGIKTVADSKASVEFTRFQMSEECLVYELNLRDFAEGDDPFVIKVENKVYSKSQTLVGGINEGVFEGLVSAQIYTVSIAQERFGGKKIYQESFAFDADAPFFDGAWFDEKADFASNTFQIQLSYHDVKEYYGDFRFVLSSMEGVRHEYPLQKTDEPQQVSFNAGDFEAGERCRFSITFTDRGNAREWKGYEFEWVDDSVPYVEPKVEEVTFDGGANFTDCTFSVTLAYEDPDDRLSEFAFVIVSYGADSPLIADGSPTTHTYPLKKTTEPQIVEFDIGDFASGDRCTFYVSYKDGEETKQYDGWDFIWEDTSPHASSVFYSVVWDWQAYYPTGEASVTLVYEDYDDSFSDFVLTFARVSGASLDVPLEKKLDAQPISLAELNLEDEGDEFAVTLHYQEQGEERVYELGTKPIANSAISRVDGIEIETEIDCRARTFYATLQFVDENAYFEEFSIITTDDDGATVEISLEKKTERQMLTFPDNMSLDPTGTIMSYSLSYQDRRFADREYIAGEVTFVDSDYEPIEGTIALTFDKKVNFKSGLFSCSVDVSDPDNRISDIRLVLTDNVSKEVYIFPLEKRDGAQEFRFREIVTNDILDDSFKSELSYLYDGVDQTVMDSESFVFTNGGTSVFNGVVSPFYKTSDDYLCLRLDVVDDLSLYSSPQIIVTDGDGNICIEQYLGQSGEALDEWNYLYCNTLNVGETYYLTVKLDVFEDDAGPTGSFTTQTMIDQQPFTLTDGSSVTELTGIRVNELTLEENNPTIGVTPYYASLAGIQDFRALFRFEDETIEVPYDLSTFDARGGYFTLDLSIILGESNAAELLEKLRNNPVDFGFSYQDGTGSTVEKFDYNGVYISVY